MQLFPALEQRYSHEHQSAGEAQRLAQEIAFAPIVFQVSRLMVKFGILDLLTDQPKSLKKRKSATTRHKSCWKLHFLSALS